MRFLLPFDLSLKTVHSLAALASLGLLAAAATPVAAETGSVKGRFVVDGDLPDLEPLLAKNAPGAKDAAVCAAEPVPNQKFVVGEDGGVANIVVYLKEAPDDMPEEAATPPEEKVVFDQKGCVFEPHVIAVQAGQTIEVKSSDGVAHNVRANFFNNPGFNFVVQANGSKDVTMQLGESAPSSIACDIHPYMIAFWMVTDHPYVAVTDAEGNFEIKNLPEGKHKFRVWHEAAGYIDRSMKVEIEAGETTDLGDIDVEADDLTK